MAYLLDLCVVLEVDVAPLECIGQRIWSGLDIGLGLVGLDGAGLALFGGDLPHLGHGLRVPELVFLEHGLELLEFIFEIFLLSG